MAETNAHIPHDGPGHETSDINVWAVGKFAFALVCVTVLSLALLFGLMKYFQSQEATATVPEVEVDKVFPEPRLLKSESLDLQKFRTGEEQVLNSYGWVDPQKGIVRIPIDRAIDIVAQKGLPSRPKTAAQASGPASQVQGGSQ
jgi:hypothetical protein